MNLSNLARKKEGRLAKGGARVKHILKEKVYRRIRKTYRKLGRALRSRKRLGYDAIFEATNRIEDLMIARNSWEGY